MPEHLATALSRYGIDYADAMERFGGNSELYLRLAKKYLDADNFARLVSAMEMHDFDEAYRQAHALKGVAGNLSFTKLYNLATEIALNLREGEYAAASSFLDDARDAHERVIEALAKFSAGTLR